MAITIDFSKKYANLICDDIPKMRMPDPETGAIVPELDLECLAGRCQEGGFVETYCLSDEDVKQLRKIRNERKNNQSRR